MLCMIWLLYLVLFRNICNNVKCWLQMRPSQSALARAFAGRFKAYNLIPGPILACKRPWHATSSDVLTAKCITSVILKWCKDCIMMHIYFYIFTNVRLRSTLLDTFIFRSFYTLWSLLLIIIAFIVATGVARVHCCLGQSSSITICSL